MTPTPSGRTGPPPEPVRRTPGQPGGVETAATTVRTEAPAPVG